MLRKHQPCHRDAWVQVVELGGAQSDLLVLLSVCGLHLQLHQLLLYPLDRLTLHLHRPERQEAREQSDQAVVPKQEIV